MLSKVVGADGGQLTPLIAAPFSISGGTATDADGGFNLPLTGDTTSRSAALAHSENDEAADNLNFFSTSFTDPKATYAVSPGSVTMNGIGFRERSALFTFSDPTFAFDIASTDGTSAARKGYSFAFDVREVSGPDKSIGGFDLNYIPAAPINPLRQRLIHGMTMREFSRTTQTTTSAILGASRRSWRAGPTRPRMRFQVEQREAGVPLPTMNAIVSALRFFTHTVDRPDLARKLVKVSQPRKLPVVLSPDEVARLLGATTCLKHQAA